MSLAATVAGFASLLIGTFLVLVGFFAIEAGKGGYGYGPFPFLKVPKDWDLIAIGAVAILIGMALGWAGWEVIW